MIRRVSVVLLVLALPSFVMAGELVTNGGFEEDVTTGWKEDLSGASATISRATGHDADPDYEALVQKLTGNGFAKLNQTVVIPSTDVVFAANAKIQASATVDPWAAAGVALHYEDSLGEVLGTTMIVRITPVCPWVDSDTFHMIPAADEEWNNYNFNVGNELANLPGVDMMAVHQIRISLFGQVGGDC